MPVLIDTVKSKIALLRAKFAAPKAEVIDTKEWIRKLHAWWEGVDYIANTTQGGAGALPEHQTIAEPQKGPAAPPEKIIPPEWDATDDPVWPSIRITLNQMIWGEGFCAAGGMDFSLSMAKHFSPLVKGMKLLDINANLGGGILWMGKKYDLDVHGLESFDALVRGGKSYLAGAGAPALQLRQYDPETFELPRDTYDCILAREYLFQVTDKEHFLNQLCQSLKERGQIIITDFIMDKEGVQSKKLKEWILAETVRPSLWSLQGTLDVLKARGDMEIRSAEDISSKYIKEISKGWKRYLNKLVEEDVPSPDFLPWIMKEIKLWAKRIEILQSGELKLYRIYARHKPVMERKPT